MTYIKKIWITPFGMNKWVANTPNGNYLLVNHYTKKLLDILRNAKNQQEVLDQFNQEFEQKLDRQEFEEFLQQKFGNANVLLSEDAKMFSKKSYLNLKVPLLSTNFSGLLATPFIPLFHPTIFWFVISICFVFTLTVGWGCFSLDNTKISLDNFILYISIVYPAMILHELGHVAACRKFGVSHGEIGFGFYSIFPVLYADVTSIWSMDKHKRTIANLGGIYLEIVYAFIWCIIYLLTNEMVYLIVSVSILVKTITELNPFIRFDGYWVLSDLTNTPNLLPKANRAIRTLWSDLKNRSQTNVGKWSRSRFFLIFYGISNGTILYLYVIWMIIEYWQSLLGFPLLILNLVKELLRNNIDPFINFISFENLIVLGFYLLFGRWIGKGLVRVLKRNIPASELGLNRVDQADIITHP